MRNIYLQIPLESDKISKLVLATVTRSQGSTPQKPGISALFNEEGLVSGTIGGGVLEARVGELASQCIRSRTPVHFVSHLDNSNSEGEDALCGGSISILIDPELEKYTQVFKEIRNCAEKRIPGFLITKIKVGPGGHTEVERKWEDVNSDNLKSGTNLIINEFQEIKPFLPEVEAGLTFVEPLNPLPQLIIAGAGHIGKALSRLGSLLDFEVLVIDDRSEYANSMNLPFADSIINGDIGKTLGNIEKGKDTFIVIVTRGHRNDGDALKACIGSDAAYIGMIGSKTKVALMKRDFLDNGLATEEQWNKIHAPVGIDIKSITVEEIAVSIAAQLIKIRNSK